MTVVEATEGSDPPPDNNYLDLTVDEITRIVLFLMLEEALRGRLAEFRGAGRNVDPPRSVGQSAQSAGNPDHASGGHPSPHPLF
jgi:hypothetical protein